MNHAFICGGEILNPSEVKKKKNLNSLQNEIRKDHVNK